jgi:predicted transcriptional regulator of viral defense system
MEEPKEPQRFTGLDSEVIGRAKRKRLDSIVLRRDREWLEEISPNPTNLVSRMARRGALIPLGGGRYAIPAIGSRSTPAWTTVIDAEMASLGLYYVGFMTALEGHRLVDLDEPEITVAIGFRNSRIEKAGSSIGGRPFKVTTMPSRLFDFGLETVRLDRARSYRRSDLERTLVDCHERPRMVGSAEVWMRAWAQALRGDVDIDRLLDYSSRIGPSASRRTGLLLSLTGHGETARDAFPGRTRRADRIVPLIAGRPVEVADQVDPYWRVAFNVPKELVEGWLAYGR